MAEKQALSSREPDIRGLFRPAADIVLASASPRRQALLASLGICFQVRPAQGAEPDPEPDEPPGEYALRAAQDKAAQVAGHIPDSLIIGADTIVVQGQTIMGKPCSDDHALEMLQSLRGKAHKVMTGVSLILAEKNISRCFVCQTTVHMAEARDDLIQEYVRTGEPRDKAGAYAIQGAGAFLVDGIQGSYTNVVGLPLAQLCTALMDMDFIRPAQGNQT